MQVMNMVVAPIILMYVQKKRFHLGVCAGCGRDGRWYVVWPTEARALRGLAHFRDHFRLLDQVVRDGDVQVFDELSVERRDAFAFC